MADDLKAQIEIEVDASGVEAGVGAAGKSIANLGRAASAAGAEASQGIDRIGVATGKAGESAERAAARQAKADRSTQLNLERTLARMQAAGQGAAAFQEQLIRLRGGNPEQFRPTLNAIAELDAKQRLATQALQAGVAPMNALGLSAKQTAAALRGVPAQFTDIITSLQAGQAPLTVLLQQGGQLKDMFAGVGNAARALGGYMLGLVNPVALTVAAVGALGFAALKGAEEAQAYSKAIILSGNAAGITAGQLQEMGASIGRVTGSQSAAASGLADIAQNGKVARDNLQSFTLAAVQFEKATGQAVGKTVQQFAELAKSPTEASAKLNETYNYLTESVYRQIKALEDQGRTTDAANLAQKTYAETIASRAGQIAQNLGVIEAGWNAIKKATVAAGNAALDVGRQQTGVQRLAQIDSRIAQLQTPTGFVSATADGAAFGTGRSGRRSAGQAAELQTLQVEAATLRAMAYSTEQIAIAEGERASKVKARIALDAAGEKFLSKREQMTREIAKAEALLSAAGATQVERERMLLSIREKYKEAVKSGSAGTGENEVASIRALIVERQKEIAQIRDRGVAAEKLTNGERLALKLQEELKTSISGVARARKESALAEAQTLAGLDKEKAVLEARNRLLKDAEATLQKQVEAAGKSADSIFDQAVNQEAANASWGKGKTAIAENTLELLKHQLAEADSSDNFDPKYIAALRQKVEAQERFNVALRGADFKAVQQSIDEQTRGLEAQAVIYADEAQLAGLTGVEREKVVAFRKIELELAKQIAIVNKQAYSEEEKEKQRAQLRDNADRARMVESSHIVAEDWKKTTDQINASLTDALLRGFEDGKGFGKNFADTLKNMFKTLVLRPVISFIVNPISQAIAGYVNGFLGTGGASGAAGGNGLGSLVSNGASLFSNGAFSTGGNLGAIYGGITGGMSAANVAGSIFANTAAGAGAYGGSGISALLATNGAYGTAGAGAAAGAGAGAGVASAVGPVIAALGPLAIGLAAFAALGGFASKTVLQQGVGGIAQETYSPGLQGVTETRVGGSLVAGPRFRSGGLLLDDNDPLRKAVQASVDSSLKGGRLLGATLGIDGKKLDGFRSYFGTDVINSSAKDNVFSTAGALNISAQGGVSQVFDPARYGVNLKGLSAEEQKVKLAAAAAKFQDDIAKELLGLFSYETQTLTRRQVASVEINGAGSEATYNEILGPEETYTETTRTERASPFTREGETALQTLTRLSTSLVGVNAVLKDLGDTTFDVSLAGGDLASKLVDLFGGLEGFGAATSSFYQNFFTEEERKQALQAKVATSFKDLGIALPTSRDAFRDLVLAQDLTTESGRSTYATLLKLSESFAALNPILDDTASAATASAAALAAQKLSLEDRLLKATGQDRELLDRQRGREFDEAYKISPALAGLLTQIFEAEDAAAARIAAQEFKNQKFDLTDRLLVATGQDREALDRRRGREFDEVNARSPALAAILTQIFEAEDRRSNTDSAAAALDRAVDAQRNALDVQRQMAQETVATLSSLFGTLKQSVADLYGEVESTRSIGAQSGRAFIAQALSTAQLTGYLPDGEGLNEAIGAARGGMDAGQYATRQDFDRDRLVLAGQLRGLRDITGVQLSNAELQLKASEGALEALDLLYKNEKLALDQLRGIDISVLTVTDAVKDLRDAMLKEGKYKPGASATPPTGASGTKSPFVLGAPTGLGTPGFIIDARGNKIPSANSTWDGNGTPPPWAYVGGPPTAAAPANQPQFVVGAPDNKSYSFDNSASLRMLSTPADNATTLQLQKNREDQTAENQAMVAALQKMQRDIFKLANDGIVIVNSKAEPVETA